MRRWDRAGSKLRFGTSHSNRKVFDAKSGVAAACRFLGTWTKAEPRFSRHLVGPLYTMRASIIFILSCASVLGADSGIQVVSPAKTNTETASITMKDVFTRAGQTNLVRDTKTEVGVVQIRIHRFYHGGSLVGDFVATRDSSGFTTEAGSPYSVSFEFDASHSPKSAIIGTKDGVILDAFTCTNGIFSPIESSLITKVNSIGSEVRGAMHELSERSKKK
jgi:hypothetical protein